MLLRAGTGRLGKRKQTQVRMRRPVVDASVLPGYNIGFRSFVAGKIQVSVIETVHIAFACKLQALGVLIPGSRHDFDFFRNAVRKPGAAA